MSNDYNRDDYLETVESIAKEALTDYSNGTEDQDQFIHESVDGNAYIIYYAGPPVVKEASSNWPCSDFEWQDVHAMAGDNCNDDQFMQIAAFQAMEADIRKAIEDIKANWEDCQNCGSWFDPSETDQGEDCARCGNYFCDGCLHLSEHDGECRCKVCHDEHEEEEEDNKPDMEMDAFYTSSGALGCRTSASMAGDHIGEFESDEHALNAIRRQGKRDNYFPSVWFIDDHGGYRLEEDFSYDEDNK